MMYHLAFSRFSGAVAILIGLSVSPGLAADLVLGPKTPQLQLDSQMAEPAFNWTGPYAGASVGRIWGTDRTTEYVNNVYLQQFELRPRGWTGGILAGYNVQTSGFVFGVEADAGIADVSSGFLDPPGAPPFVGDPGARGQLLMKWQGSARLRAGYSLDRLLVFATGGWATAHFSSSFTNQTSLVKETFEDTRHTWTVGGGLEYAITDSITARLEYRYTPFGSTRYHSLTAFPGFGISATQDPVLNEIRTGISVRF